MDTVILRNTSASESFWEFKGQMDFIDSWALMGKPYAVMVIVVLYIAFVTKLGPQYMKNRSPYKLRKVIIAYNVFQVLMSFYFMSTSLSFMLKYGFLHKKCVMSDNEDEKYQFLSDVYYGLLLKICELLDTVFFVLRKKKNQVSFLHVYHHAAMLCTMWIGLKYDPNENFVFAGFLNTGVHVIMYAYYGLSAFPKMKKYLWWKKYITTLQLIQFAMIFIHLIAAQFISDCPPSTGLYYFALINMVFLYYLFNNFYKESYVKSKKIEAGEINTQNELYNDENAMKKR